MNTFQFERLVGLAHISLMQKISYEVLSISASVASFFLFLIGILIDSGSSLTVGHLLRRCEVVQTLVKGQKSCAIVEIESFLFSDNFRKISWLSSIIFEAKS